MPAVAFDDIFATVKTKHGCKLSIAGPALKGKATFIVPATRNYVTTATKKGLTGKNFVIKAYWPEISRNNEADIIRDAHNRLLNSSDMDLKKNLPRLVASKEFATSNTGNILSETGLSAMARKYDHKPRIRRLLLFPELAPLDKVLSMDDVVTAWVDCFKCHYALWSKGIEHSDISVWNLMWDDKNKCGILNDWDLSFVADGVRQGDDAVVGHGGERTGTAPFMARQILEDIVDKVRNPCRYRHEVESFIWVFTWMCLKEHSPDKLKKWRKGSHDSIRRDKQVLLTRDFKRIKVASPSPGWDKCKLLLRLLLNIDRYVDQEKDEEPNNHAILEAVVWIMDGTVTKVKEVDDLPLGKENVV